MSLKISIDKGASINYGMGGLEIQAKFMVAMILSIWISVDIISHQQLIV